MEQDRFLFSEHNLNSRRFGPDMSLEQQYYVDVIDWMPQYEIRDEHLYIDDPVWGREIIGDQAGDKVLVELANHDALKRLQAVEQLTLPRNYTTIPNTSLFSRWEHIWGSVVLTRRLARKYELSSKDSLNLQLRTLLSDVGHTTGSHLGDWLFQGLGGSEDQHDQELTNYLEATGVNEVLKRNNINPNDVIFPKIEDWIESPQPDLCIDRLDYALREMRRWLPGKLDLRYIFREDSMEDLVIKDGKLAMTDKVKALTFAESFLELSREHWNDPVHRLQLALYMERAKRVIAAEHGHESSWLDFHPRDVMYCSDPEYLLAMQEHDPFGYALDTIMDDIARYERKIGWYRRKYRVQSRLYNDEIDSADSGIFSDYLPHHPMLKFEEGKDLNESANLGFEFLLTSLKVREIDPLILVDSNLVRLSEIEPKFQEKLIKHRKDMSRSYLANIAIAENSFTYQLQYQLEETNSKWIEAMKRPRMNSEQLKRHIGRAASWANNHGFIYFTSDKF